MDIETTAEDLHDPYGACIEGIHKVLAFGYQNHGGMSDSEHEVLTKLQEKLKELDPAISIPV